MRKLSVLVAAMCGSVVVAPLTLPAQEQQEGEDFVSTMFNSLTTAKWNVFANGGALRNGRFLLQEALAGGGQRSLRGEDGWSLGLGGGVDILPRLSVRMGYSYASSDLVYRTDNGDGSDVLDIDDGAGLNSHLLSLELMRYMFPSKSFITPYGSGGVTGTWWNLDESQSIASPGGGTQFRVGALASFGVQVQMSDHFDARVEIATGTTRNPFTGNESYVGLGGFTIDEPTRVSRTDFRLAGVYRFTGRDESPAVTVSRRPQSRR